MTKYWLIVIAVFICTVTYAQQGTVFHRGYPLIPSSGLTPDTSMVNIAGLQVKDGEYLSLDAMIPEGDSTVHYYVITKYKHKGDIRWTKKFEVNNQLGNPGFGSMYQSFTDTIYFSFTLFDGNERQIFGAINAGTGEDLWVKSYDSTGDEANVENVSNLITEGVKDSLMHQLVKVNLGNTEQLMLNTSKRNGTLITSKLLTFSDEASGRYDYTAFDYNAVDDGFIATGSVANLDDGIPIIGFTKFNSDNTIALNKVYSPEPEFFPISGGLKTIKSGKDYYIAGQFIDINLLDFLSTYFGSFLMKVDSTGNILWSKIIDKNLAQFSSINGMVLDDNGNVIIAGKMFYNQTGIRPYMISISPTGTQNWLNVYEKSSNDLSLLGKLVKTKDKGFAFFHHDISLINQDITRVAILKTDSKGAVGCETPVTDILFIDHNFFTDTLLSSSSNVVAENKTAVATDNPFGMFDIPIVKLNTKPFCPSEPIDWTFNGKAKDAVSWKWSDGSTADTLRVFETGEYTVTVTIDGEYCFMLCDTAKLERTKLPTIEAFVDSRVCVGAPFKIKTRFTADSNVSAEWTKDGKIVATNVGELSTDILGTYNVKIVDQCGDSAKASITITDEIYFPAPSAGIAKGGLVCKDSPILLTSAGAGGGGGPYTFKWSTGQTTSEINVAELKSYTVTVTDVCGLTASASISLNDDNYFPPPSAAIAPGIDVCKGGLFLLTSAGAGGGGGPYTFKWSTGQTTSEISVTDFGTYSVTVTDVCNQTAVASETFNDDNIIPPSQVIISSSFDSSYCKSGKLILVLNGTFSNISWSTGETTSSIIAEKPGEYSVTATDDCKNETSAKIDAKTPNIDSVGACVFFPKIFYPKSQIDANAIFRPFTNECGKDSTAINSYELHVYNRWGQELFSSKEINVGWDGTNKDNNEPYPFDTYVWYSRFKIGTFCNIETKGDITILR